LGRILSLLVLVPVAIALISFSVANRQIVDVSFDPTGATDPAFALQLPMFVVIFATLAVGLLLGGIGTWFTQGKHRKLARKKKQEADKWQFEAEKQKETQDKAGTFASTNPDSSFPVVPSSKAA
jgi:hypothetical protein